MILNALGKATSGICWSSSKSCKSIRGSSKLVVFGSWIEDNVDPS